MGHIGDGLHHALEFLIAHFIEQQRENNGGGKAEKDGGKADGQRVAQQTAEIIGGEKILEMLKAHPLAAQNAPAGGEIFKGDNNTVHGLIAKNNENHQRRNHQQVGFPILL